MLGKRINIKEGHLDVIYQVSRILSKSNSFSSSLKEILRVLYAYMNIQLSFISIYDEATGTLRVRESFGFSKSERFVPLLRKADNVIDSIFKNELPIIIYDVKDGIKNLRRTKYLSRVPDNLVFIGVPMRVGGEKFGVLGIYTERTRDFSHNDIIEMLSVVSTLIGLTRKLHQRMEEERQTWQEERSIMLNKIASEDGLRSIIGVSDSIMSVKKLIKRIAPLDSTVLLTGESGTGKSLVAKAIHMQSLRKDGPFVTISCAAIPENLLEAELFGYEKGAFTSAITRKKGKFELASGGTIFLDEIGDMPLSLQAKLLNVIQDQEISRLGSERTVPIDVRIIAATNKDLTRLIEGNLFREDLYYRLNIIPIHLPPLRNRRKDISLLIDHFKGEIVKRYGKEAEFTSEALKYLINYDWPGNIRELQNTVERLIVMNDGVIDVSNLPQYIKDNFVYEDRSSKKVSNDIPSTIEQMEKENIEKALADTGYVKSRAAKVLGYTIRQLDYRIKKYGIRVRRF